MKNIHILSADKPSRFQKTKHDNFFLASKIELYTDCIAQNIYITSDEEIKDSYVINTQTNDIYFENWYISTPFIKKIILTTDRDLIEDGVQAIDDEFLVWFVKNPSCEEVGVELEIGSLRWSDSKNTYKIIIPKEEPKKDSVFSQLEVGKEYKQEVFELGKEPKQSIIKTEEDARIFIEALENIPEPNEKLKKAFKDFHKQETLEEAAIRLYPDNIIKLGNETSYNAALLKRKDFIDGAKWRQERSYSEEDLEVAFNVGRLYLGREGDTNFEQLIEQLKNK